MQSDYENTYDKLKLGVIQQMSYTPQKMLMLRKIKKGLRNGSRLKENKETWQLNAMCKPGFNPRLKEYQLLSTLCDN